jgi:uncharacterized protein (DUF885 family)
VSSTAGDRLRALADRYWRGFLHANPSFATIIGERSFDDRLEDLSDAARQDERARLRAVAVEALAIDPAELDAADRITRHVLVDEVEAGIAYLESRLHDFTVDPLEGPQVELLNIEAFQTIETPDRGQALLRRWEAMAPYLGQATENLRSGLAGGRVGVHSPITSTIEALRELERQPLDASPLLRPLRSPHDDWPAADWAAFRRELLAIVGGTVRPAFAAYRATLEAEVLPTARPDDRPGLLHLDGGDDAYRRLIRHHTTLELEPADLHAVGLAEVERTDRQLVEVGRAVLGRRSLSDIQAALRGDPALHFRTHEEVLDAATGAVSRATKALPGWFGRLPKAACDVVEVPAHEARHSTVAYYVWPASDGSRAGRYYVNTSQPETRPRYDAETLAFHEAVPGHHLQIALAQEQPDLPAFRRYLGSTAFAEGWALYAEILATEMGLLSGEIHGIGRNSSQAWRAARLVVDTGLHAFGWTRDQAIAYLTEHTALAGNTVVNEVDRYIVWPGQALAYLTGQQEILALRDRARVELGARFDISAFHDAVLSAGAVPLGVLRLIVDGHVAERRG